TPEDLVVPFADSGPVAKPEKSESELSDPNTTDNYGWFDAAGDSLAGVHASADAARAKIVEKVPGLGIAGQVSELARMVGTGPVGLAQFVTGHTDPYADALRDPSL